MIRVAITGPESTGKSWLAEQLALRYKSVWVKEYAREFLEITAGKYDYGDILKIAKGQLGLEEKESVPGVGILFLDTEFIVTRIWCEVKFGRVHPWILEQAANRKYDLYLLCNIDLPWEFDPLREHPEMRQFLFDRYLEVLRELDLPFGVVSGTGEERLLNAVNVVDRLIAEKKDTGCNR